MAHFYNKNQQSQLNAFNSGEMFTSSNRGCKVKENTYMGVLDMFRRVLKNIHATDIWA